MKRKLLTLLLASACIITAWGQSTTGTRAMGSESHTVTFRFVPGDDMFYIPWNGNDTELNRLYTLVDRYHTEITNGSVPIYVDGYASGDSHTTVVRSNRVKSELITHKGLREEHFITNNHATPYIAPDGKRYGNMVVVTLRVPSKPEPTPAGEVAEPQPEPVVQSRPEPITEPEPQPEPIPESTPAPAPVPTKPYGFAVRTNLLYDAFLTPTLGVEWRVNAAFGVKLDGSLAWWGDEHGKVQKVWLVSPEVRWYLGSPRRLYVGVGGNYGEYNIYKGMLGGLFSGDTGYQGKLYGGGLTVGYQLPLSRSFSLDFNLGLGYTRLEYDSFTISNETRIYKERDKTKNFWGPTQAGISFVWKFMAKSPN